MNTKKNRAGFKKPKDTKKTNQTWITRKKNTKGLKQRQGQKLNRYKNQES